MSLTNCGHACAQDEVQGLFAHDKNRFSSKGVFEHVLEITLTIINRVEKTLSQRFMG